MQPSNRYPEIRLLRKAKCQPRSVRIANENEQQEGGWLNAKRLIWSAFAATSAHYRGPRLLTLTYYNFLRSLR
jgi:hypothetical protein